MSPLCHCYRIWGDTGNWHRHIKLWLLAMPGVIKPFVSDPGASCLVSPSMKQLQPNWLVIVGYSRIWDPAHFVIVHRNEITHTRSPVTLGYSEHVHLSSYRCYCFLLVSSYAFWLLVVLKWLVKHSTGKIPYLPGPDLISWSFMLAQEGRRKRCHACGPAWDFIEQWEHKHLIQGTNNFTILLAPWGQRWYMFCLLLYF